eukprot:gene41095-50137_t
MAKFTPWDNPMGTDGFEFIEFAAPDPAALGALFETMGFKAVAKHRHKSVTLYRQGGVNFIINAEPDSFAQRFARLHGPSVCAIAFRVGDAKAAYERAISLGAWGYADTAGPGELNIPAIKGIGDSIIYFIDQWRGKNGAQPGDIGNIGFYDVDFNDCKFVGSMFDSCKFDATRVKGGNWSFVGMPGADLRSAIGMQGALREEDVMGDVERGKILPDHRHHGVNGALLDERHPLARAEFVGQRLADGDEIVTGVEARWNFADLFAERLPVTKESGARQHVNLRTGVVDVVFLGHVVAGEGQKVRQR